MCCTVSFKSTFIYKITVYIKISISALVLFTGKQIICKKIIFINITCKFHSTCRTVIKSRWVLWTISKKLGWYHVYFLININCWRFTCCICAIIRKLNISTTCNIQLSKCAKCNMWIKSVYNNSTTVIRSLLCKISFLITKSKERTINIDFRIFSIHSKVILKIKWCSIWINCNSIRNIDIFCP